MGEGLWSQTKRERDRKRERIRREGKEVEVAVLTVCQHGFVCQYSTAPRHCTEASWLWPKTHTHTHTFAHTQVQTHIYPLCVSLSLSLSHIYTHTHTLGRKAVGSRYKPLSPFSFLFLIFCRPSIIHSSVPSYLCACVCHYSYVAGGGGGSSGPVWPTH